MNIFSACDGLSGGQITIHKLGIPYENYFASEIHKPAIKVTQSNFPNTTQVGCIKKVQVANLPKIDFLIGGTPCQGFSFHGKQLNFEDPRSKLFFEFLRILEKTKAPHFFLENVRMEKKAQDVISKYLGVEPITVNSSLVSAQNRVRLYWTNLEGFEMPKDKNIFLQDILEDTDKNNPAAIRGRQLNKAHILGRRLGPDGKRKDNDKKIPYTQCLEVLKKNSNKSNCLTTVAKDNVLTNLPHGRHPQPYKKNLPFRYYTTKEYCRLQTIPEDYFDNVDVSENQIRKMVGNGWTIDVITEFFKLLPNANQSRNIKSTSTSNGNGKQHFHSSRRA